MSEVEFVTAEVPQPAAPAQAGSIAKNAGYLVLGQAVSTGLGILVTALLARILGASDFGVFYLASTITAFAYVFVEWGQSTYLAREVARRRTEIGVLLGSSLAFRTTTAFFVMAATEVVVRILGYDTRTRIVVALMILTYLPRSWGLTFGVVFRGVERMEFDALGSAATGILSAAVLSPILLLGGHLHAAVWAQGLAATLSLVAYASLYRKLGAAKLRVTFATCKELFFEGMSFVSITLFVYAHSYIDAILLSRMAPENAVGWYAAANRFVGTLLIPATIMGSALYPRLSRLFVEEPEQFGPTLRAALRPLLWLGGFVLAGTWLLGDLAVSIVFGRAHYEPAIIILKLAAPGLLFTFLNMVLGGALIAARRQKPLANAKFGALAVAVVLDAVLIPFFQKRFGNGGIGVALSLTLSEFAMMLAIIKLSPKGLVGGKMMLQMIFAVGAATAGLLVSMALAKVFVLHAVVGLLVFCALSFALGLVSRKDLDFIVDAIQSKRRRTA